MPMPSQQWNCKAWSGRLIAAVVVRHRQIKGSIRSLLSLVAAPEHPSSGFNLGGFALASKCVVCCCFFLRPCPERLLTAGLPPWRHASLWLVRARHAALTLQRLPACCCSAGVQFSPLRFDIFLLYI
ncbi:hypothetical protein SEVIR_5G135732v4 [Setaria viridis]